MPKRCNFSSGRSVAMSIILFALLESNSFVYTSIWYVFLWCSMLPSPANEKSLESSKLRQNCWKIIKFNSTTFFQNSFHNHLEWDILARLEDELLIAVGQSLPHDDVRNSWLVHNLGHSNNFWTRHFNQLIWMKVHLFYIKVDIRGVVKTTEITQPRGVITNTGWPRITNVYCKSRNLPNKETQSYSTDLR